MSKHEIKSCVITAFLCALILIGGTTIINSSIAKAASIKDFQKAIEMAAEMDYLQHCYELNEAMIKDAKERGINQSLKHQACVILAKTVFGEAGGLSKDEQAAVAWCVCNRAKNGSLESIINQATRPHQFDGYKPGNPVIESIYNICDSVLTDWMMDNNENRILPAEYKYFMGDGEHNYFCQQWHQGSLQYAKDHAYEF